MHEPLESGVLPYCNQLPYESAKMNTKPTRRQALTTGLSVAGACLATPLVRADERDQPPATEPIATTRKPNSIAVSTYSYWRYRDDSKLKIEECIDLAAEAGFDGVEILHVQMQDESNSTLQRIKQRAFRHGLDLCGFSTHQSFVSPDPAKRQKNVEHTIKCIELPMR